MKFISRKELQIALQSCSINEISSFKDRIVNHSESVALATIKSYLGNNYDMDYELRPYKEFQHSTIYNDNDRIRITNNQTNHLFEYFWNIELIDSELYVQASTSGETEIDCFYSSFDPLEDGDEEMFLVKTKNTCESKTLTVPIYSKIYDVENFKTIDNPNYSESCGIINGSDGVYNNNSIYNIYNSNYQTVDGTNSIITLSYNDILITDIPNFQTVEYFDQYLLENINRDFKEDDRNVLLIQMVLDIAIYTLIQRISPRQIPENILKRYEDCLEQLKMIQRGDLVLGLKKHDNSLEFSNNMNVIWGISRSGLNNTY